MSASIFVTTTDPVRLHVWRRVFRSNRVPVKTAVPRWQYIGNGNTAVLAYDLDEARLRPKQRERFCHYVARVKEITPIEAERVLENWPIPAHQCHVI